MNFIFIYGILRFFQNGTLKIIDRKKNIFKLAQVIECVSDVYIVSLTKKKYFKVLNEVLFEHLRNTRTISCSFVTRIINMVLFFRVNTLLQRRSKMST